MKKLNTAAVSLCRPCTIYAVVADYYTDGRHRNTCAISPRVVSVNPLSLVECVERISKTHERETEYFLTAPAAVARMAEIIEAAAEPLKKKCGVVSFDCAADEASACSILSDNLCKLV